MSSVKLADTWHTTTFRLTLTYGALFGLSVTVLLTLIYWQTATYIGQQIDNILKVETAAYSAAPATRLPDLIAEDMQRDARHINFYGLFSATGELRAGNLLRFPINLPADGQPHGLKARALDIGPGHTDRVRMLARRLPDGTLLVIGRDETQIGEIGHILLVALAGAGMIILIVTLVGASLSRRPVRRIRDIQRVSELIMHGDIHRRLPIAGKHDELDMLAHIINRMLDALEAIMRDVKGATDSIAHDLRTPLTRLRAMLYRTQTQMHDGPVDHLVINQAIAETDALLARFRALMRIAEISSLTRRAGFAVLDIPALLQQVQELYAPLADDQGVRLTLTMADSRDARVIGDSGLLFEALANIVDNAIKFTPAGGTVAIALRHETQGLCIEVQDTGVGIAAKDLNIVTQPFYRGEQAHQLPGFGLGLSIVTTITRLHDFQLALSSDGRGTRVSIACWSDKLY